MTADRYEISECELDVLAITGPEGTRYIDGEDIEAKIIRQQARDIAELRADLAAAVAERDEARTAYQVRNTEWHQYELIALALAERYKLRAEQAEARLAVIDAAPTVALVEGGDGFRYLSWGQLPPVDTQLIARPAKD